MIIVGIIGYLLFLFYGADFSKWLYWFNFENLDIGWVEFLANDIAGKGAIGTIVWMTPFILMSAFASAKTGFTGTEYE